MRKACAFRLTARMGKFLKNADLSNDSDLRQHKSYISLEYRLLIDNPTPLVLYTSIWTTEDRK